MNSIEGYHESICAFAQTLPGNPNNPPRLHTSSNVSTFTSAPSAPLILNAIPRGRLESYATVISTRPDIGGCSGEVMTILAVRWGVPWPGVGVAASNMGSRGREEWTVMFTGMLRGTIVPANE